MQYGLSKTIMEKTVQNMQKVPFSLNIDEASSTNHKKVLSILVNYFSDEEQKVVTEHLTSVDMLTVTSESLYNTLVALFEEHSIPWGNLVSILMDSCAVMRGSKTGKDVKY